MHAAINQLSITGAYDYDNAFCHVLMHVFMALPPCAADALTNAARVSVFAIPPPAPKQWPGSFLRVFVFEVPPLRSSPPFGSKGPNQLRAGFCFRGPPQRNEGPEQHKRVLLFPGSPSSAKQWPG